MEVGLSLALQNLGKPRSDGAVYEAEFRLVDQAEALGFDSVWATEHHFTDYEVTPNPLQLLTYVAGRTNRVKLGTMAVILPWHDPIRVAEEVSVLDHLSEGRVIFGVGRGLGNTEFDGFSIPMSESRGRFDEAAQIVLSALESGKLGFDGEYYSIPSRELRPAPRTSFRGRTYSAAVSPESLDVVARLGLGVLVIAQKPWETVQNDLENYRTVFVATNGEEPPPPVFSSFVFCHEDGDYAANMAERHIGRYYASVLDHYQLAGSHFGKTSGYSYYEKTAKLINEIGSDEATRFFVDLQVWGTPDQCYDKICAIRDMLGAETFVAMFAYGGLPDGEAEQSMQLFAETVMPRVQALGSFDSAEDVVAAMP